MARKPPAQKSRPRAGVSNRRELEISLRELRLRDVRLQLPVDRRPTVSEAFPRHERHVTGSDGRHPDRVKSLSVDGR